MARASTDPILMKRLSALGDLTRLRMLRVLEREELAVGEISSALQLPQSTVSRHVKVLLQGGWIEKRSAGAAAYYRVVMDDLDVEARALWLTVRGQIGEGPDLSEDLRRLETVLAERKTDSAAYFGRVAGEWDAVRSEMFGDRFTLHALLGLLRRDWTVADLGCGTGNVAELLTPWVERVVSVDSSEVMLAAARHRLTGCANVEFVESDLDALPLDDGSVDVAVCVLVLHHVDGPVGALKEMRRVLRVDRGGGIALVVDMYEHTRDEYARTMGHKRLGFSEGDVEAQFAEAGFGDVHVTPLPSESSAMGPGLFAAVGRV